MRSMGRHEQREQIFRLLFRVDFYAPEEFPEQVKLFFEDEELQDLSEKDKEYITEKSARILEKLPQLDEMLGEKAEGWKTSRMGKVDLTVLRLALYEILYDEDVPVGAAINEAVEIAKEFGQDTSGGFVNAILAKFA